MTLFGWFHSPHRDDTPRSSISADDPQTWPAAMLVGFELGYTAGIDYAVERCKGNRPSEHPALAAAEAHFGKVP